MPVGIETFVGSILRSGLLGREQLEAAVRATPEADRGEPDRLAQHLVKQGALTQFQAKKLLQGTTLGLRLGPYRVLTPIGRGGMGCVYLARDTREERHVAIKVLPPKKAREEERLLARFQREMAMSQRIGHPHLARTLEAGVWQGVYYIAMEYIPGHSLHRLVASKGPLDVPRAARIFSEVAAALEHAHSLGLIHRDLKPSNIMVTPRGHAKVLDLGLAIMLGEEGALEVVGGRGYVVGSADFMAPEQSYDSTQVDARTDVYALGCSLYFALAGAPPFQGSTTKEKMQAHRHQEPPPLQWKNGTVPDDFAALVHQMLLKNPAQRLPSMGAVREALKPWGKLEEPQPLEQEGDSTFQNALAELEKETIPDALLQIPIVRTDAEPSGKSPSPPPPQEPPPTDTLAWAEIEHRLKEMRRIGYFVAAFCGVMVILLAVLLFLVLRL